MSSRLPAYLKDALQAQVKAGRWLTVEGVLNDAGLIALLEPLIVQPNPFDQGLCSLMELCAARTQMLGLGTVIFQPPPIGRPR